MSGSIDELMESLSVFDVRDLAAGVGALQLLPENADHLLRIERLAGVVASLPASGDGAPQMSPGRWRTVVNSSPIADSALVSNEDPFEEPYTEAISFYGGSYTILPGLATGAVRIARRLTEALFAVNPALDRDYVNSCGRLTRAVFVLADRIAARASLRRATAPVAGKGDPAVIPAGARLGQLKDAVRWRWAELEEMLGGDIARCLGQLAVGPGQLTAPQDDQSFDDQPAVLRPLLDFGDELIVLLPTALLTALRHWIFVTAGEHGLRDQLAERYREATIRNVGRSLWVMGFQPTGPAPPPTSDITEHLWNFDHDKVAHLVVVTDPLTDYQATEPFGRWPDNSLSERVERVLLRARNEIRTERGADTGVLHLVVLEGVGRWVHLGLTDAASDDRAYCLTATSDDLEVMSRREAGDPLAIWKFAQAAHQLRNETRVFQWSTLDEYAIYLDHERSFYLGDERRPTFLNIQNASATQLRVEDAVGFDAHAALHPSSLATVHIQRRYEKSDVPVYATDPLGGSVDFLIELTDLRIWVVSDEEPDPEYRHLYFELKEAVAYWLWQIAEGDGSVTASLAAHRGELVVHVVVLQGDAWSDAEVTDDRAWATVQQSADGLYVTFAPSTNSALAGADNVGERELVALLLTALNALAGVSDPLDTAMIDQVAPLGPKKKIVVLAGNDNLALMPGDLPRPRIVDDSDIAFLLDEMGEWLSSTRPTGDVPDDERVTVLNSVVAFYFGRLEDAVALLSPTDLIAFLIRHNESLVRDEAQRRLTLPTRIACFGLEDEARAVLTERLPKLVVSAVASRFLIEFVAARPPAGTEPITNERYDELLSIASEIVNKGYVSDAIHFGLSEMEVSVLASGRLGLSRDDTYQLALEKFRAVHVSSQVGSALSRFAKHWPTGVTHSPPDYLDELQKAFSAEFGVTLSECAEFTGTVINIGMHLEGEAKRLTLEEFGARVAEDLQWTPERVVEVLERFALVERSTFLAGSPGEIYPWRYGRDLSYLRRPYVITSGTDPCVFWGTRHLDAAGRSLLDVCLSGRLKAQSAEMRRFMGAIRASEPELFNDDVAAAFAARSELVVRPRVKKVGKLRIERASGEDIGDIDVLVADPSRRRLLAVETKDFETARTPSELSREIEKLVTGPKSANHLHSERADWLRDHRKDIVDWLGLPGLWTKWTVTGLIVVSTELMSPMLASSKFPIVTLSDLRASGLRWR